MKSGWYLEWIDHTGEGPYPTLEVARSWMDAFIESMTQNDSDFDISEWSFNYYENGVHRDSVKAML